VAEAPAAPARAEAPTREAEEPARRTRSRRGGKSSKPVADAPVETPAAAAESLPQERPAQEAHLRQSDRRGGRAEAEPQRTNGRPFGEAEVPAFLRRAVSIKT